MKILKNFFACLFFLPLCACFAQNTLSASAKSLLNSFFDLRMNVSLIDDSADGGAEKVLSAIDDFSSENENSIKDLSEQEKIILDNFIVMERYNYLIGKAGQDKIQQKILGERLKVMEAFSKKTPESELDPLFLCTKADVTSCYMAFSVSDVLKFGTSLKPLYEKALEKNPDCSYILTNIGQWYYFAPKIIGGSKKKTLSYFEKAREAAKTPAQKYFADIFLSQLLFENKDFDRSRELLAEAETFCPGSFYLAKINKANARGISLYQYNKEKSALSDVEG